MSAPREFKNATTSLELWRLLTTDAGLQAADYDAPLVEQLRKKLNLPDEAELDNELATVPMERFVEAFLQAAAPYAAMWTDLLAMFERAAATAGESNIRIAYNFGEAGKLDLNFDLEHFRAVRETVELLQARFNLSGDDLPSRLWNVRNALNDTTRWDEPTGGPEADDFVASCRADGPWPRAVPALPASGDPDLDRLLEEARALVGTVLAAIRSIGRDRASLRAAGYDEPNEEAAAAATAQALYLTESDYWLSATMRALVRAAYGRSSLAPGQLAQQLEEALAPLRNLDPRVTEPRRRLEEFLQLPIWKHRYELYSNWVCTQVMAALEGHQPVIHADRGTIRFSFSGTHLVLLCYSRLLKRTSWLRSTGCWQVRQRPAQQRRTGWRSSTVCGSVRPAAGLLGLAARV